jgi:copper chaperone CopZ
MDSQHTRIATIVVSIFCLGTLLGFAEPATAHHSGERVVLLANAETGRTYLLTVEGMSCPTGCAPKVEAALRSIDGVESVDVDYEKKQARVRTSPGHTITQQACDGALGNSGYFVDAIKEVEAEESG